MKPINPNWKQAYKAKLEELKTLRNRAKPSITAVHKVRKQYSTRHVPTHRDLDIYNDEVESESHLTIEELKWLI